MSPFNVASRTQVRTSDQCPASVPKHEPDAGAIFRNKSKCPRQGQQGHTTSRQSEQNRVASSSFKTAPFVDVSRHGEHPHHGQRQYRPVPGQAQGQTHSQTPRLQHPQPQQSLSVPVHSLEQSMDPRHTRSVRIFHPNPQALCAWKMEQARMEIEMMSPDARARVMNEMRQKAATDQPQGRIEANNLSTVKDSGYFSSPHVMPPPAWTHKGARNEPIQGNHSNTPRPLQWSPIDPSAAPLPSSSAHPSGMPPPQGRSQFRQPSARRPMTKSKQGLIDIEGNSEIPPHQKTSKRKRVDEPNSSLENTKKSMTTDGRPMKKARSGHPPKKGFTPAQMHERQWRLNKEKEDKEKQSQSEQKWARELQGVTDKAIAKIRVAGALSVLPSLKIRKEAQPTKDSREHLRTNTSSSAHSYRHYPTTQPSPRASIMAPSNQARDQANTSYTYPLAVNEYGQFTQQPPTQPPFPQSSLPKSPNYTRQHGLPSGGPSSGRGVPAFAGKTQEDSAQTSHATLPQSTRHQRSISLSRKRQRVDDELASEVTKQKKVKTSEDALVSKAPRLPTPFDQAAVTEKPREGLGEAAGAGTGGAVEQANDVVDPPVDGCSKDVVEYFLGFDIDEALRQYAPQNHYIWGDAPYTNPIFTGGHGGVSVPTVTAPTANEAEISTTLEGHNDFWGILDMPGFDQAHTKENSEAAPESSDPATKEIRRMAENIARLVADPTDEFDLGPILGSNNATPANQEPTSNLPPLKADREDFAAAWDNHVPDPGLVW